MLSLERSGYFQMPTAIQRKLTTVLAADAAGYSRRMETDEIGTLTELRASRSVFVKLIERHNGRVANTAGDGLIAEFPSVVEAVQCALEVQRELADMPHEHAQLRYRIGIHLGDVIVDGDDLLGEGVNLAARLESMAEPGGILISQQVFILAHTFPSAYIRIYVRRLNPIAGLEVAQSRRSGVFNLRTTFVVALLIPCLKLKGKIIF